MARTRGCRKARRATTIRMIQRSAVNVMAAARSKMETRFEARKSGVKKNRKYLGFYSDQKIHLLFIFTRVNR